MQTRIRISDMLFICVILILVTSACSTPATPTSAPPTALPVMPTASPLAPTLVPAQPTASLTPTTVSPTRSPQTLPTAPPPTQTALPKDARGFSIVETEHAIILAQPGVSPSRAQEVGKQFEIGYQVVAESLAASEKRPRLYVYRAEEDLFQDLIVNWKYGEWFKNMRAIPRMNRDYEMWIPPLPRGDAWFIAHEYSHRIIEQIAGVNSQFSYKWLDEGFAEYVGARALEKQSANDARIKSQAKLDLVISAQKTSTLIHLRDMTTEEQLVKLIERDSKLAYAQAAIVVEFLISQSGTAQIKNLLGLVGKGTPFPDAFQKTYSVTIDEFEKQFFDQVAKLGGPTETDACMTIDGRANDWQTFKPLIVDNPYAPIAREADVRQVFAVTCKTNLYLMIVVDSAANASTAVTFALEVDTNGDDKAEYQPGFDRTRAWLWNLKGTGYADMQKNMTELTSKDYKVAVGEVVEFMLPLRLLDNSLSPRIRVYTFVGGQMANRQTAWGTVPPLDH